ncbi:phosphoesterase [Paenibacillus swuensis]|uniref:Phosphoesterase n=1 Tax=Paenibacillus swuensis TaxID=1178515 RepID=A0A172TH87_9BACL|nr:metallophosphoesterase [Paenibacillus swuensis]ANE46401.1 phosphoesterase [Paenibacillus swuensis]
MLFPIILFFFAYLALNFYIGWNGYLLLDYYNNPIPPVLYWMIFTLIVFAYILGRTRIPGGGLGRGLKRVGSYYFAVMEFAILLLPLADFTVWILHSQHANASIYIPVIGWSVVGILTLLMLRGSWNARTPIVRTHHITISKRAGDLKQLRIAVASDLHLGDIVSNKHMEKLVRAVNLMKPDLLLLPGDIIDDVVEPFIRLNMPEALKRIQTTYGTYAILGNHEYYGGSMDRYIEVMRQTGIPVLRDEVVEVEGLFQIAGRKDKTAEAADPNGRLPVDVLLAQTNPELPIILLDHQPYHLDKAAAAGADVMLSGHTHRGQFAPNHWVTRRLFELDWGYKLKGSMHAFVSSGFGTWGPPIRLASRAEILEIVIHLEKR